MNISAVNCTPIKPQASFGMATRETDNQYDKIVMAAQQLEDSFVTPEKEDTQKSKLGVAASLAGAVLVTYMGGRFAAAKVIEAFPKAVPAMENGLKKASGFIQEKASTLAAKDGKVASTFGKIAKRAEEGARNVYKNRLDKGDGAATALKRLSGTAALMFGLPKIATVDGNNDGISDITQKNANAYKSALNSIGIVSDVVDALS